MKAIKLLQHGSIALGILAFICAFSPIVANSQVTTQATTTTASSTGQIQPVPAIIWPTIKATSAYIYDPISDTVIYAKNADTPQGMASLVKVMTAAVADNLMSKNPKIAEKSIRVSSTLNESQADRVLKTGTSWYIPELIKYMLLGSSNKAAQSISRNIVPESSFVSLMNHQAKQYGLTKTKFYNSTGLAQVNPKTKVESAAGITTAKEMAHLFWKVIQQNTNLLDITRVEKAVFLDGKASFEIENTNKLLKDLPIRFGKTGFTQHAGGNLVVVLQKTERSHPYIIVVLNSTASERFTDVYALATTTLAHYEK